jgi:hypothetical protein
MQQLHQQLLLLLLLALHPHSTNGLDIPPTQDHMH